MMLGAWPSIQELATKRHFELFYYDFATGIFAAGALMGDSARR
jgi:hypothetical protein